MIPRTKSRQFICTALLILNVAFIWGNSMLNADVSGAFSEWVRSLLSPLFPPAGESSGGYWIRKAAHFSEFVCLGVLFTWFHGMLTQTFARTVSRAFVCGSLCACIDETIQIFTPGRCASLLDVMIDSAGVVFGITMLMICQSLKERKQRN